jgi:transposase-like protein
MANVQSSTQPVDKPTIYGSASSVTRETEDKHGAAIFERFNSMKQSEKVQQVKQQAQRMSARLQKMGFEVSPRQALELVAAERGFTTWNAYEADLRKPEPKTSKWSKKQGAMTQAQYMERRAKGDNPCPYCGSSDIDGGFVEVDGKFAFQSCSCNACESEWTDRYVIEACLHGHNAPEGSDEPVPVPTVKGYAVALYDQSGVFVAKGFAFGNNGEEAKKAFLAYYKPSLDESTAVLHVEYAYELTASREALVAWWKQNDAAEDALDELVHEAVQIHGLPELNDKSDGESQEGLIEDAESQGSRINNEGIEAQLEYLLSVREPRAFLTQLALEIGLTAPPPSAIS